MAEIKFKSDTPEEAAEMINEAVENEKKRLRYSIELIRNRLSRFEEKYGITSKKFLEEWTAEDLEGEDLEYVDWSGELKLLESLVQRLDVLIGIEHVTS